MKSRHRGAADLEKDASGEIVEPGDLVGEDIGTTTTGRRALAQPVRRSENLLVALHELERIDPRCIGTTDGTTDLAAGVGSQW